MFYIDAKSTETNEVVAFTLSSPMDLQGLMIPTRQLHSLCTGVSVTNTAPVMDVTMPERVISTNTTTRLTIHRSMNAPVHSLRAS